VSNLFYKTSALIGIKRQLKSKLCSEKILISKLHSDILVVAGSGGISTFAVQGAGKNWWKLDRGTNILGRTPLGE
jgi:hypothetical protein